MVILLGATVATKWVILWPFSIIFLGLAFVAMLFVRRGEAGEEYDMVEED
jgi:hypothetical protein